MEYIKIGFSYLFIFIKIVESNTVLTIAKLNINLKFACEDA